MVGKVSHVWRIFDSLALLHAYPRFTHQLYVFLDKSVEVSEPNHHFPNCPIQTKPNQIMFNNVDMTNLVTNSNDEEVTIPSGYYTIGEIIAILNTMTDTVISISTSF